MKFRITRFGYAIFGLILFTVFWAILITCFLSSPKEKEIIYPPAETIVVERTFIPDIEIIYYPRVEVGNTQEAEGQYLLIQSKIEMINQIIENFAELGVSEERIEAWANSSLAYLETEKEYYQQMYDIYYEEENVAFWTQKTEEHPTATYIWLFLKEQGFNDYVAAGILGNMMTEAGGQSLAINPSASNGSYYGICQWGPNFPGRYVDLDGQLQLLMNTIENEFAWYGTMSYESFCNLDNERDAALVFARSYERCTSRSYNQRQNNASVALEYFVESWG